MVASLQASTHPNLSDDTLDTQWRQMQGTDGIRQDFTGAAFGVTLSTSAPTLTVASAGRSFLVDGNLLNFTTDAVLDPRDVGTLPTGSQIRRDLVVCRYDTAVATLKDRGTLAIKPGTPGTGTTPVVPTPTQTAGGVWEVPVASHALPASGLLTSKVDLRSWSGDHAFVADLGALRGPLGSTRTWRESLWLRAMVTGAPTWVEIAPQVRPQFAEGRRNQDGVRAAGVEAQITSCSVVGAGRTVTVDAVARLSQEAAGGDVDLWITLNNVTIASHRFRMAAGEQMFVPLYALATASVNNPTVPIVLRARTSAGSLAVRTGSQIRASSF